MHVFEDYLKTIKNQEHLQKIKTILDWVIRSYPDLKPEIKWNQPMFIQDKTYIISFGVSSKHISCAPELEYINKFSDEIKKSGYERSKMLIKIPFEKQVDYDLLKEIIDYIKKINSDLRDFGDKST